MISLGTYDSSIGVLTVASDGENITGLWLEGQKYFGATLPKEVAREEVPPIRRARDWLDRYFAGEPPAMTLPLAPDGSDFRKAVWRRLLAIPYGKMTTYGDISREMGSSARAVGGAVGHNPIAILIPCHRVMGADGSLTGYAGGIERKEKLLRLEGAAPDLFAQI